MSSFTEPLEVSPFSDDMVKWILTKEFTYMIGDLESNQKVVVPKGFVTDFATTWPFHWILPRQGKYGKAAVVHDYLCTYKTILVDGKPVSITRKKADKIFLEAMEVSKVNVVLRYGMYGYVRLYATVTGKE